MIKKQRRLIPYYIALFLSLLFVWGVFSSIIINESLFPYYWTYIVSVLITIICILYFATTSNHRIKSLFTSYGKTKVLLILSTFVAVFTIIFLSRSLPLLVHTFIKEPSQMTVTISSTYIGDYKFCHRSFELQGYNLFFNGKVCKIDEKTYSKLDVGDSLTLIGDKSIFGFTVNDYH